MAQNCKYYWWVQGTRNSSKKKWSRNQTADKNLKHHKEEQRKQRQNLKSKNDRETTALDEVYEDSDFHWKNQNAESPTKIVESTIAETTSEVKIEEINEHIVTAAAGYSFLEDDGYMNQTL